MQTLNWKKWEIVLLVLALLTFMGTLTIYVSEYPIRKFFVELPEDQQGISIGKVQTLTGSVTRESFNDAEFKPLATRDALFSQDTIVSGAQASVILQLDDGGLIELGPNTMVKLNFER